MTNKNLMSEMIQKKTATKKYRGRPKLFSREELVAQVMELFWEKGYNNLSLNEIAKETGLTRASLYNAFTTKEALFLEAVNYYAAHSADAALERIKSGERIGPVFYRLFDEASKSRAADKKRRGCLAINCINELIASNTELGETFAAMYDKRRMLIQKLIRQAIDQKELAADTDPELTANMIQTFITGFSIFSKNMASEKKLRAMSHGFLLKLGFSQP